MAPDLDAFLAAGRRLEWTWARTDCTAWMADWCLLRFGFDPIADLRLLYHDETGADALIVGGLAALLRPRMARLPETASPKAGDVGVITVIGRETSAICTGPGWAFRTLRGLGEAPARPLIAWSS